MRVRGSRLRIVLLGVHAGVQAGARLVLGLSLALCGSGAQLALAQQAADESPAYQAEARPTQSFNKMIQSLIVTARKTEERLQQVPVALTAFSGEELARSNKRRIDDLPAAVPNLLIDQGIGLANTVRTSLRGLSTQQSSSAADPVIGIYVDGVYRTRLTGSLLTLFDIDRVEVLRGPQGALFGKNTVGGAINITTKAPEFEFGGMGELRVGNFDTVESRFALNVPLVPEKAAVRLSLATATRDGFTKNVTNGDELNDNKLLGGRMQFLLLPREDVEVQLTFEGTREDRQGVGIKCVLIGNGSGVPGLIAQNTAFRQRCAEDSRRSELKVASDVSFQGDSLDTLGTSARVSWDVSPDVTLSSISAWRRMTSKTFFNVDGTDVPLIQFQQEGGRDVQQQLSQEFQLTGITAGGRLRYVGGLFALVEEADESEFFGLGFRPNVQPDTGATTVVPVDAFTQNRVKTNNKSFAVYGQGTYSLTERLDLTVGARLTKDSKRVFLDSRLGACRQGLTGDALANCQAAVRRGDSPMGPMGFTGFERTGRFDKITPSATLAYAFSPKFLAYASYATGFQSGGFDGRAASILDTNELDNQENTTYEVGIKSSFFSDRVIVNAAYFYNILSDGTRVPVPRVSQGGQLGQSQNLDAEALVRGGELEIALLPLDGLQLRGNLGVQRAELEDFSAGEAAGLNGSTLPISPNYTMNFVLDYERQFGGLGTVGLNTSWTVRGKQNPVIQAPRQLDVSKYGLLDGRISYKLPDERTEIAAYGTNLLDRRYFYSGFSTEDTFGFGVRFFGPPRFYGMELRRSF
jgi:iron complex outermembrane receptor protein